MKSRKIVYILVVSTLLLVFYQNCSLSTTFSSISSPDTDSLVCESKINFQEYVNNVNFVFSADGEVVLSSGNYNSSLNKTFFQLAYSKDDGKTWCVFIKNEYTPSSSGLQIPIQTVLHRDTIFSFIAEQKIDSTNNQETTSHFLYEGNKKQMTWNRVTLSGFDDCIFQNLFAIENAFYLFGKCGSIGTLLKSDSNFTNLQKIDFLPATSQNGSTLSSLLETTDGCFYYSGSYWNTNGQSGSELFATVKKSCDRGVTWTTETTQNVPGNAGARIEKLYEWDGKVYGVGSLPSITGQSNSRPKILMKNQTNQWEFNDVPSSTNASHIDYSLKRLYRKTACEFIGIVDEGASFSIVRSVDCGRTWEIKQHVKDSYFREAILIKSKLTIGRVTWNSLGVAESNLLTVELP